MCIFNGNTTIEFIWPKYVPFRRMFFFILFRVNEVFIFYHFIIDNDRSCFKHVVSFFLFVYFDDTFFLTLITLITF